LLGERDRLRHESDAGTRQFADGEFTDYDPAAHRQRIDDLQAGKPFRPQ
jgi:phage baseplate assembly protein gpV